jgi:hypothetical protein
MNTGDKICYKILSQNIPGSSDTYKNQLEQVLWDVTESKVFGTILAVIH